MALALWPQAHSPSLSPSPSPSPSLNPNPDQAKSKSRSAAFEDLKDANEQRMGDRTMSAATA